MAAEGASASAGLRLHRRRLHTEATMVEGSDGGPEEGAIDARAPCAARMETLIGTAHELHADEIVCAACDILARAFPVVRATLVVETDGGPELHTWRRRDGGPERTRLQIPMKERDGIRASLALDLDAHPPPDAPMFAEAFVHRLSRALVRARPSSVAPASSPASAPATSSDSRRDGAHARSGTHPAAAAILLVEDDDRVAQAIGELLELEGNRVQRAANGREALAMMRAELPRVVLLDVHMPQMDGREFRRRQLADEALRAVPVIVTSANFDGGFDDGVRVLPKPFSLRELNAAMNEAGVGPIRRTVARSGG